MLQALVFGLKHVHVGLPVLAGTCFPHYVFAVLQITTHTSYTRLSCSGKSKQVCAVGLTAVCTAVCRLHSRGADGLITWRGS